ncbi:PepSY-associated TM helix domain-containing protein [Robbsia sp. KACC 23696]|uniref:PepSY-associated TM helix domain-containing protein n=1 Tax=Robbsia sp. KACC 23696 TaxID=3149231 RepID=UPI00325AD68C
MTVKATRTPTPATQPGAEKASAEKPRGFRQSMAWLHTWAGLLVGWVLFMVFAFGTVSYYRTTLTDWMQPERLISVSPDAWHATQPSAETRATPAVPSFPEGVRRQMRATTQAADWLAQHAAGASRWTISLPGSGVTNTSVSWQDANGYQTQILPGSNGLTPRATEGGDFFYNFHFQLRYLPIPIARWIISACAMSMLVALISGIVTHRRIFVDFFTFRPRKGQRSWLDAHNVSAVLALPYHLMITYTGLATLMVMLMPWGMKERYPDGGAMAFYGEAYDFALPGKASGQPLPLPPLLPLLHDATARFGNHETAVITVDNPGDAAAQLKFSRGTDAKISVAPESVTYDAHGTVIATRLMDGAAASTVGVMYGLHEARFAPPLLRAIFFLSGLAGTLMVASGLIIWTNKQRQKRKIHGDRFHFGLWLVERLNLAAIGGLPLAMAAYFYANRLIPALQPQRAALEVQAFFVVWAIAAVHAALRSGRRGWIEQTVAGAAAFAVLPIVDRLSIGSWVMPGFDLALLAAAILLGTMARYLAATPRPARAPVAPLPGDKRSARDADRHASASSIHESR